jgi:hypothetical protein
MRERRKGMRMALKPSSGWAEKAKSTKWAVDLPSRRQGVTRRAWAASNGIVSTYKSGTGEM